MYKHRVLFSLPDFTGMLPYGKQLLALHFTKGNKSEAWMYQGKLRPAIDPHWILNLNIGNGAGYIWGRSLYLAYNCLAMKAGLHSGLRKKWAMGLTQNANIVPYSDGT